MCSYGYMKGLVIINMKRFKHINCEMRKIISSNLSIGKRAIEIVNDLGLDISAVSKETKRNRVLIKESNSNIEPKFVS